MAQVPTEQVVRPEHNYSAPQGGPSGLANRSRSETDATRSGEDTKGTGSDEVKIGLPDEVGIATSDVAKVVGPIEVTAMTRDNAKPTSTADGDNQTNKEE